MAGVHALCQLMDGRPLTLIPFKLEVATIVTGIALACVSILWLIHAVSKWCTTDVNVVSYWLGCEEIQSISVVRPSSHLFVLCRQCDRGCLRSGLATLASMIVHSSLVYLMLTLFIYTM